MEQVAILLHPFSFFSIIRHHRLNQHPERLAVVVMDGVRQLVDDNIIDDLGRGHNQAPGEAECAMCAAGSPTGAGAADADFLIVKVVKVGEISHAFGQVKACLFAVPGFQVFFCMRHRFFFQ